MFRNRLLNILKSVRHINYRNIKVNIRNFVPLGLLTTALCEEKQHEINYTWGEDSLEHEFLIRQATTVNVNAATQLLTVTLVAIQDTSERLREVLSQEISLIQQALEWGDGTPPQHWDQLVAVRGSLCDLKHNLTILLDYMDYAKKLATVAAEVSYLSGNIVASDAICERIDHACRVCNNQERLIHDLQQESLEIQQLAIMSTPHLEEKLKNKSSNKK